jgi:hypothetical protein
MAVQPQRQAAFPLPLRYPQNKAQLLVQLQVDLARRTRSQAMEHTSHLLDPELRLLDMDLARAWYQLQCLLLPRPKQADLQPQSQSQPLILRHRPQRYRPRVAVHLPLLLTQFLAATVQASRLQELASAEVM